MEMANRQVKSQTDCGASVNVITKELIGNSKLAPTAKRQVMWSKTEITPLGVTQIIIRNPKKKYSAEFLVVAENLRPLIGAQVTQHMKLIIVNKESFMQVTPSRQKEAKYAVSAPVTA